MADILDKNKTLSLASIFIIVGSYAGVKMLNIFVGLAGKQVIALALVMTALLGFVLFLLYKCESAFMGLLAAIIGYKMMPVGISGLTSASLDASMLYSIVQKAGLLLFVLMIIRFFRMQGSYDKIKVLPILAIMVAVKFSNDIWGSTYQYFISKTGSMLGYYFMGFACYIIASLVILLVSYSANYDSMRFAAYFQYVAMGINILRRLAVIIMLAVESAHISKSYYCWIAIYIVVIISFYLAKRHKKKLVEGQQ